MTPRQPAPIGVTVPSPDGCVERDEGGSTRVSPLPFLSGLRDRAPARGDRHLPHVLRAARPGLRLGPAAGDGHPRAARVRPAVALALRRPPAGHAARRAAARARPDAARSRTAARRGGRRRRALAQARHRQPDAFVQGPCRRRRRPEGAGARARHALLLLDREPRRRRRRAGGGGGVGGRRLRAGRPRAGEARRRGRLRAHDLRGGRPLRPLLAPLGRALVRASVGLRQRQPPLVLRGGLEDARVRARRAARLARA